MANKSNRAYFLEHIKTTPMTIADIMTTFDCSRGTARSWVNHPDIVKVEGSYPVEYKRANSIAAVMPAVGNAKKTGVITYEIPEPSPEEKESFFRKVLAAEVELDFVDKFRKAESSKDLKALIHALKVALVTTEYYLELMKKDEAL